jgi:transcriptional regulator with XRE-family HTH domain
MDEAQIIARFCKRLKTLRQENGLTLEELAQRSGVSISSISKTENQLQSPSFETVLRISRALQINFVHMLEPAEKPAPMARRAITRAGEAPNYAGAFADYASHAAEISQKTMVPLLMRITARALPPPNDWSVHEGEEFLYVLSGVLELHTAQYAPAVLRTGDSCYLDSTMRHAYVSTSPEDAVIMSVCSSIQPFPKVFEDS